MVPYKYTHKTYLQFPTLAGESPKWNILVVAWADKYALTLMPAVLVLVCIYHSCPCYNYVQKSGLLYLVD